MEEKDMSRERYMKLYCENQRVRRRMVIYLSEETNRKLTDLAYLFHEEGVCKASLADNIIRLHIETHIDLLKQEAEVRKKKYVFNE